MEMFYGANPLIFKRAKELRNNATQAEMVLWEWLKTKPLGYKFRRQHPIDIYIADFFCFRLKLVIEVDGFIHDQQDVKKHDEERQEFIEANNIKILRFTNKEVTQDMETVIKKIQSLLHPLSP